MGRHDDQVDAMAHAWRAFANRGTMLNWQAIDQVTPAGVSHLATATGKPLFFLRCRRCGHAAAKLTVPDMPCDAECWRPRRRDHPPAPKTTMQLLDQALAMAAFLIGGIQAVAGVDQYAVVSDTSEARTCPSPTRP